MEEMLKLVGTLGIFMLANIGLGSAIALINGEETFDWKIFWRGVAKAAVVLAVIFGIYYAGILEPDLLIVKLNDIEVTTQEALVLLAKAAVGVYAVKAFANLAKILKVDIKVSNLDAEEDPVDTAVVDDNQVDAG